MKFTKRKIVLTLLAGSTLLILSPYILFYGSTEYDSIRERLRRIPFNSQAWQDPKQVNGDDPVRIRMIDDLMASKRLDRRSRAEVEKLLGNLTNEEYFTNYDLVYWLGPERGFMSIDSEWLVIKFDSRGFVSEYRIVRD